MGDQEEHCQNQSTSMSPSCGHEGSQSTHKGKITNCCHRRNKWILFSAACFQALTSSTCYDDLYRASSQMFYCIMSFSLITGVVIFGWPNIEPVLVDKGVFISRCDPETVQNDEQCDQQLEALALVFTVASAVSFAFNLINGM